jgi:hypothetical protein
MSGFARQTENVASVVLRSPTGLFASGGANRRLGNRDTSWVYDASSLV